MSYLRAWEGFLYLAVVVDAYSRRVVGWAMADHLRTEPVRRCFDEPQQRRLGHLGR
ncbi:DDE-type integrase/transposase/recombinase [Micromonospora tulbaghiae]|uniref:DDE-type integrase/transposase/recombinase n=1 Tax=Micromonospora tulbaghiae TaxID=479978 RepID=UPI003EBBD01A